MSGSCSQGWGPAFIKWSGFEAPKLPGGSTIQAIYPVVVANGVQSNTYENMVAGIGDTTTASIQFTNTSGDTFSGQFEVGPSLGSESTDVEDAWIEVEIL